LSFDFTNNAPSTPALDTTATYDKVVLFGDFLNPASGKTFYFDDVEFGVPQPPILNQVDLPITFDDASVDYHTVSFGMASDTIVVDPTDPMNMVLQQDKPTGAQTWAGTVLGDAGLATAIPFSTGNTTMSVKVWAADAGTPILLKVEDTQDGSISVETMVNTTMAGAWETLVFDFTNNVSGTPALDLTKTYDKVVVFGDFGNAASGKTFYFDDVEFGGTPSIGLIENNWMPSFDIYPNPNNGQFSFEIELAETSEVEVTLMDLQGKTIYNEALEGNYFKKDIELQSLTAGIYLLRLSSEEGMITKKVIIQ